MVFGQGWLGPTVIYFGQSTTVLTSCDKQLVNQQQEIQVLAKSETYGLIEVVLIKKSV